MTNRLCKLGGRKLDIVHDRRQTKHRGVRQTLPMRNVCRLFATEIHFLLITQFRLSFPGTEKQILLECDTFGTKIAMRLPSEAEWEYACRGGTTTTTWVGDLDILGVRNAPLLDDIAWYGGNCGVAFDLDENGYDATNWTDKQHEFARGGTRVVRRKEPNPFGLYDMLGNVYEWCSDIHDTYTDDAAVDPAPVSSTQQGSSYRVQRGGAWRSSAKHIRAAARCASVPRNRDDNVGFRLARGPAPSQARREERSEGRSSRGKAEPTAVQRPETARAVEKEERVVTPDSTQRLAKEGTIGRWSRLFSK